jgi:hypothetical protein
MVAEVGAAFCSPLEKKVNVEHGFLLAESRMRGLDKSRRTFRIPVFFGITLERAFTKYLKSLPPETLSKLHVPDRLIEKIHHMLYRSFQTKRSEDG